MAISKVARDHPEGVIVPHRNRTRVLGGLLCAFYNGRDARCPCYAAKMAAFPVRPRQARPLPWRRSWGDRPTGHAGRVTLPGGRSPYTANRVSLHGDSVLPTRRIASPYTEGLGFLHGGCVGDIGLSLNCCQCCQYPIPIPNWPLATLELATIPHWQHSPTTGETRKKSIVVAGTILV